ncbi:MAG: alkaline phosphatase family protein [Bryobacteraceae bacterium]
MHRRHFLFGSLNAALARPGKAAPRRKIVVALFDGFGPEYLEKSDLPTIKKIAAAGGLKIVDGLIPSVTNVNNASLATGTFPSEHGITTNFYYDPATGKAEEMKLPRFLMRPTILEKARQRGWKTAIVSSKDKIRSLCSGGAGTVVSAEFPEPRFVEIAGPQENMYSAAVNYWSMRMARHLLAKEGVDLLYLSTTDYMMHTNPPDAAPSLDHLHTMDKMLGEMLDDHAAFELYLTADHGMNAKTEAVDPVRLLREQGIEAAAAPIISDNHKAHHQDLGGTYYIYLRKPAEAAKAIAILKRAPEVEEAYERNEAATKFHLMKERIGDLFLLARKQSAFGDFDQVRKPVTVRTHGSRHEAKVPILVHGRKLDLARYRYNFDLTRYLDWERA